MIKNIAGISLFYEQFLKADTSCLDLVAEEDALEHLKRGYTNPVLGLTVISPMFAIIGLAPSETDAKSGAIFSDEYGAKVYGYVKYLGRYLENVLNDVYYTNLYWQHVPKSELAYELMVVNGGSLGGTSQHDQLDAEERYAAARATSDFTCWFSNREYNRLVSEMQIINPKYIILLEDVLQFFFGSVSMSDISKTEQTLLLDKYYKCFVVGSPRRLLVNRDVYAEEIKEELDFIVECVKLRSKK